MIRITNPSASGVMSQNLVIQTYEDDAMTKVIDSYTGAIGLNILNHPGLSEFDVTFPTASD